MPIGSGISLICNKEDLPRYPDLVRIVEDAGFDAIGLADSPARRPEMYIVGALCAQNTKRIRFGPWVTNPISRDPMVAAASIASLSEISGGRAFFGIGTGDSAAHAAGGHPSSLQELEEYIHAVRGLTQGKEVLYKNKRLKAFWTNHNI